MMTDTKHSCSFQMQEDPFLKMFFSTEVSFSEVTITLFVVAAIFISIHMLMKTKRPHPPGPWSLPILGNLLQVEEHPYISFQRMRKKYGDVFQIKLGMVPVVVVNGLDAVKQVLLRDGESFAGRPDMHTFSFFADGDSMSFSVNYGESWKLQKKIAGRALKLLSKSEAKSSTCSCLLEEHVCDEASELVKILLELSKNGGFDPAAVTTCTAANVVCALCFGKRYNHNDEEFLGVIKLNDDFVKASSAFNPADFIPCLRYLPLPAAKVARTFYRKLNDFVSACVEYHCTTYDKNYVRDITDALINVGNEKKEDGKTAALSDKKIISTVNDIFGAGFSTVSACLLWIYLYLISKPEIQTKIQEEIDEKIGLRPPRFDDRKYLHYTEAFINEIFRHCSFLPFTIPHCTTRDAVLNGYYIPQSTCIFINMYQVNHDEDVWEDPYSFKPERFLNESGELNKSLVEKVLIFGMGIRKCLGEELARNEVFVIITTILQQLRLEKPPEDKLDLTPMYGLTMSPKPYRLQAALRT
ncbi:cytochrome P450 1A1 isoform X1 [Anolis carolinensis]|uniref:Cytochrome P450 1A n=2 Tax=Anolis carolinensis TaxID=28377 RepID=G1KLZ1_ANOCA|nr:PREDICTED: cytochrome P450 1A1 isoform X1 [Anolis carolinensis]|eukprot:XP_008101496.1 PREDICTED: cytochrome P450 1A1 isoform X1 [Anolis carolinensis]